MRVLGIDPGTLTSGYGIVAEEDHRLFPMADRVLMGEAQESLLRSFADMESHDMGAGTHEKYLQLADELADRFGVTHANATSGGGPHACGCPRG